MEIEKDIQVEKSSPEREEDAHQTEYVRITEKLTDIKQINRFNFQLRNSKTNEEKLSDLRVLSETPSPILYKFYSTPGLRTLGEWIYEGCDNIQQNADVLEKIFTLLKEMQLRNEHLENAHYLGLGIEKMHIAQQNSEDNDAFNIFYKFFNLNKSTVNDWLESFKKRSSDPNFRKQQLWSEQSKLQGKRPYNALNNNNNNNNNNKYPQKDYPQNKFNQNNNFQKGNNNKYGNNNYNQQRSDSPPTQKKVKYNNGTAGTTGFNNNSNPNFKQGTKSVRFTNDDQVKKFRKEDEPIAPDMTEAEVENYQQECTKKKQANIHIFTTQDMRERENKLEKESRNQQKESEKKERQMLDDMKVDIPWKTPMKIKGLNSQYFENLSAESLEKKIHEKRILCKMQSLYGADSEIPNMPSYDNVINDQQSAKEPKKIFLNKLDENDFIQVIEMAIKNENKEQKKKNEKKVLKSILKVSKEEKEAQRLKMIQEKKKQAEDEERIKSQINQHTFNQLIDLIMNNKNSSKEELIGAVKNLGLSEVELHSIYQNIGVIKKVWHQRQAIQSIPQGKYAASGEEKRDLEKGNIPPPVNQQPFNNNFGARQGSNSGQVPLSNNQNQQQNFNNPPPPPTQYGQQNQQNNSYNQYRSQQVNPQQNYQNNQPNNNYQKPPQNNNQFMNQIPQQNNFNNQRFGSNNGPNNNQNNFNPNQQGSQQNNDYNHQPPQNVEQSQQPYQNYQNQGQNQYNNQQQHNQYQQNNNSFNNHNNNRGVPQQPRSNNPPFPHQQNNNNQFNNQYQQQNRQFGNNQVQQQQQQPPFQQQKFYNNNNNNNNNIPNQSQNGIQNKPFPLQNQQNKPPGFNSNNQPNNQLPGQNQIPGGQIQNQESNTKHVPCRMYHSDMGCKRDICNFLHVPEYQGRAPPNMHKMVRPMHSLSKNGERNLENTFEYNKAKFEKKTGQLNALPFPMAGGSVPPPPPNQQQNAQFGGGFPSQQQQPFKQQPQPQQNSMFLFQSTNALLKQQQYKPQPPQKI